MPVNSDAAVRVDIAIISGDQVISIPSHLYFRSLSVEMTVTGSWTGTMDLYDPQGDFLENLVIVAGLSRGVRFSFGRGAEVPEENRTFSGNITKYRPVFEANGVSLTLEMVALGVIPALVDRNIRAFPEGERVSDMVDNIAVLNGWSTVNSSGRATIEQTDGALDEPFHSSGESDYAFIARTLVPLAVSNQGVGDYLFFVDGDNVVHFHTPDFLEAVQHEFVYARSMAGDVISFAPSDESLFGLLMGGGRTVFGGLSSVKAGAAQVNSTATGGIENQGFPVQSDSGSRFDYGTGVSAYLDMATRNPEELKRLAQSRYDKFRKFSFRADMQVHGTHRVRELDWVNIRYLKLNPAAGTSPEHYLSGRFRVNKIRHEVSGAWTTSFDMLREGIEAQGTQPVQATQSITPPVGSDNEESIGVDVPTI